MDVMQEMVGMAGAAVFLIVDLLYIHCILRLYS